MRNSNDGWFLGRGNFQKGNTGLHQNNVDILPIKFFNRNAEKMKHEYILGNMEVPNKMTSSEL